MEASVVAQAAGNGSGTVSGSTGPLTGTPAGVLALLDMKPWTIEGLALRLNVSRRDIEAAIEELRLLGEPIIASSHGVRLTQDPDELSAYVEARRRRMASMYLGSRALRRTIRRLRERTDLTLFGAA